MIWLQRVTWARYIVHLEDVRPLVLNIGNSNLTDYSPIQVCDPLILISQSIAYTQALE